MDAEINEKKQKSWRANFTFLQKLNTQSLSGPNKENPVQAKIFLRKILYIFTTSRLY